MHAKCLTQQHVCSAQRKNPCYDQMGMNLFLSVLSPYLPLCPPSVLSFPGSPKFSRWGEHFWIVLTVCLEIKLKNGEGFFRLTL
jgi:hypothetical protein